jgi:hypothetical protein
MPLILGTNSIKDTGYDVANSLRFEDGSTDYLSQTSATTDNEDKGTISVWIKRSDLSRNQMFASSYTDANNRTYLKFGSSDNLDLYFLIGGVEGNLVTNRVFRDTSAWYHIVVAIDTTQGTASNRVKLYINGVQETSFSTETYPAQNANIHFFQSGKTIHIGNYASGNSDKFSGYMCEFVFANNQQLGPTSLGEFDADSPNIWKPIDVSGLTFGTNGFYLDFENASSLGADVSGNSNNFTVNNLTSVDQSTDTCTNNFCTFTTTHPSAANFTLSEGNLKVVKSAAFTGGLSGSSIMPTTGKWYFEALINEAGNGDRTRVGVINYSTQVENNDTGTLNQTGSSLSGVVTSCKTAKLFETVNGSTTEYTNSGDFADGDIVQFAMDLDNKAIYIGRNGTFLTQSGSSGGNPASGSSKTGAISTNTTIMNGEPMSAFLGHSAGQSDQSDISFNFGSPPYAISSGNSDANGFGNFEYAVPSGYFALCTKNLAESG